MSVERCSFSLFLVRACVRTHGCNAELPEPPDARSRYRDRWLKSARNIETRPGRKCISDPVHTAKPLGIGENGRRLRARGRKQRAFAFNLHVDPRKLVRDRLPCAIANSDLRRANLRFYCAGNKLKDIPLQRFLFRFPDIPRHLIERRDLLLVYILERA